MLTGGSLLVSLHEDQVTFRWKDCRHHDRPRQMTVPAEEFIRRLRLLPARTPAGLLLMAARIHPAH